MNKTSTIIQYAIIIILSIPLILLGGLFSGMWNCKRYEPKKVKRG